ncbi:O-antigen ligase family protein [Bacteroides acidifaciens]|uniref:O-antigen ligase family protein n=1 Tax=Bacteroides acidifaciens TaxID=85831 RepID=UPI0030154CC5
MKTATKYGNNVFLFSIFLIEPITSIWYPDATFRIPYLYCLCGLLLIAFHLLHWQTKIYFSWIDILIFIPLVSNGNDIFKYHMEGQIGTFLIFYLLSKTATTENRIANLLTISGCFQVFLMLAQFFDCLPSNHSIFPITGSFKNPGPLGGYLAISLIASIANYTHMKKGWRELSVLILLAGIIYSDSRATWIATIFALSYMGMQYWKIHPAKQWSIALLLLLLTGIFSLTLYKTQSAKGRIEIWKICCTMIGEHPLTGFGFGGFQREYMNYQTHYIQQSPSSDNHRLLNNNRYAFNEFLHITVEQGIIGLFSFLSILILLYIKYTKQHSVSFPCLITYILFSCFSYPNDIFLLFLFFALLLGKLSADTFLVIQIEKYPFTIIAFTIIISLTGIIGNKWVNRELIEKSFSRFFYRDDYKSLSYIQHRYSSIQYSSSFIFRYARVLFLKREYQSAIPIIKQAIGLYPTTDKYCDLATCYLETGKYKEAENAFSDAIAMLPHHIIPRYQLYLLYKKTGEKEKADHIANSIIRIKPKNDNEHIREIKNQLFKEAF